jgi:hypothetical protein
MERGAVVVDGFYAREELGVENLAKISLARASGVAESRYAEYLRGN